MPNREDIQKLLIRMVQLIVDHPEEVAIETVPQAEDGTTTFRIIVSPRDMGKIIGRQARNAQSIRIILGAMGMQVRRRYLVEIDENIQSELSKDSAHQPKRLSLQTCPSNLLK